MREVCMAKLSQQLEQKEVQTRPTRTERVKAQQDLTRARLEEKRINEAREKISQATYENYEQIYNSISPKYRQGIMSPTELKQTEGYKKYKREQEQLTKIRNLITSAQSVDRGNAFWGYNRPKSEIREMNAFREGIGTGSKKERRKAYLYAMFPDIDKGRINQAVETGTVTHFDSSANRQMGGMDKGEVRTITVRDTKTGEIKRQEVFTGTGQGGYTKETTTYLTGDALKQEQEKAYQEFLKENPEVNLPQEQKEVADDRKWYEKSLQELIIQPAKSKISQGFSYVTGKAKQGLDIADDYVKWDFKLTGSPNMPKVQLISFGKKEPKTDVEGYATRGQEKLGSLSLDIQEKEIERQLGETTYEEFKESKQEQADKEVSSLFYRSDVGREAFFSAKTDEDVDKAFKEFQKSDIYSKYEKQYSETYTQDLNKLIFEEVPYKERLKGVGAGLKMAGLSLGSLGISFVKSPTRAGLTAGALYTGGVAYSSLPTSTLVGLDIAFATGGAGLVLSPTTSIEQKGTGALMLGVSSVSLSAKGVSYLRQPTVKAVKIASPVKDLRASATVGKDIKSMNRVVFENQKLSQVGVAGRRTVVSTRWRDLLGLDPIYKGVPYAQRGLTTTFSGLRGSFSTTSKSGYQKAFDLLTKRGGSTSSQAKATLRYFQPRIIEQYLSRGILAVQGKKALGIFEFSRKQPVVTIDKTLGIKTRGARTIKDISVIERELISLNVGDKISNLDKVSGVLQKRFSISAFEKPFKIRGFDLSTSKSIAKSSDLLKGFERIGKVDDFIVYKPITYKNLAQISRTDQIKVLLKQSGNLRIDLTRSFSGGRTILIDETKLLKQSGLGSGGVRSFRGGGLKTPFSKTFGSDVRVTEVKDILKESFKGTSTKTAPISTTDQITKTILKQAPTTPTISVKTQIKNLMKIDQAVGVGSKTTLASNILSASASRLKADQDIGLKINVANLLKNNVETKQSTAQRSAQRSATAQISQLLSTGVGVKYLPISISTPRIPEPRIPSIPTIPIYFPPARAVRGKGKKKSKSVQDLLYLPDFTSRAIGLKAETISEKQAKARLKKILTGFEIRRGVRIA